MQRDPQERLDELLKANTGYLEGWREEKKKVALLRDALKYAMTDNVWHAYYAGVVKDDLWFDRGMADAEWLERELGLSLHVRHRVEDVIRRFAELVERLVKQAEAGK